MSDVGKMNAALAALDYIQDDMIIGVGTGSTVNYFISALKKVRNRIDTVVSSSKQSTLLLKEIGLSVTDLNSVSDLTLYVDGADEVNAAKQMIKGGGGAQTNEKIVATVAKKFICIVDQSKKVDLLGNFPVAVEVLHEARSYVARQIVQLGANPVYREGFITDHGNVILDVYNLKLAEPKKIEDKLKSLVGVVESGIFANRPADVVLVGSETGVETLT